MAAQVRRRKRFYELLLGTPLLLSKSEKIETERSSLHRCLRLRACLIAAVPAISWCFLQPVLLHPCTPHSNETSDTTYADVINRLPSTGKEKNFRRHAIPAAPGLAASSRRAPATSPPRLLLPTSTAPLHGLCGAQKLGGMTRS